MEVDKRSSSRLFRWKNETNHFRDVQKAAKAVRERSTASIARTKGKLQFEGKQWEEGLVLVIATQQLDYYKV